jgi:hypothetical protein
MKIGSVRGHVAAFAFVVASFGGFGSAAEARLSDAQIRQAIVKESIANYSGNCPCPYNSASNGSRCGGRSAYSRGGGAAPLCFPSDVSQSQVNAYRR